MGLDTTSSKKPILQDAEQNIGNSEVIYPQAGPAAGSATTIPQKSPARIIQLSAGSAAGQTTSVIVTATRLPRNKNPTPGFPGPITGIIEFGNGGRSTSMEFDVPMGPFIGSVTAAAEATEPRDGIAVITVPTGVIRLYARYDSLLIEPLLNTNGQVCLADVQGVPRQGPGGPVVLPLLPVSVPAEPVQVQAMAAYFSKRFSFTYRTLYCYVGQWVGIAQTPVLVSGSAAPAITPIFYVLPAFTRSLKVLRQPLTSALNVTLRDSVNALDNVAIAAGVTCPTIPIIGHETIVTIESATAADTVTMLALCCEVGI